MQCLTKITAAAALVLSVAPASANDLCNRVARVVAKGVVDGQKMSPVLPGIEASVWMVSSGSEAETRVAASAYLMGYSQGLVYAEPAEVIAVFMNGCMSEGA